MKVIRIIMQLITIQFAVRVGAYVRTKDPATRNDFVNDIVNDAGVFHRRRWNSTIVTISSKLDMLTFDRR